MTAKNNVVLEVEPGICGFSCLVKAERKERRSVKLSIEGSACGQIRSLAENLPEMSVMELFVPLTRNPIFLAVEKAGCHLSCPVPIALIKAAEIALDMALPKDVSIIFRHENEESANEKK